MLSADEIGLLIKFVCWLADNDMHPTRDVTPEYLVEMFTDDLKPELDETELNPQE